MARLKTYILACATFLSAIAIGYAMQKEERAAQLARITPAIHLEDVEMTSARRGEPTLPAEMAAADLPETRVALDTGDTSRVRPALPQATQAATDFACMPEMTAEPAAGAMIRVALSAPCRADERVTLHHQGLMVTQRMAPDGTLEAMIPALSETATVMASFLDGAGASATTEVSSLYFYDRVAVQWQGDAGLQLHAREYGSDYFQPGHVWAEAAGDLGSAARGEGGFLVRLGHEDGPDALVAEVYTFPVGTAARPGDVALSVEVEVTAANCDSTVAAQTLQRRQDGRLQVRDVTMPIPDCGRAGDFLVLKNLVQDLTIAAR
ncbi:translocase [Citreimonas sp.]|uniref:translocase n=1 Tax=Citreimonas sp. TaxID=3036715 RepID=UPI0040587754